MIAIRKSKDRGHIQQDWLESYHSFSFGDYHDPKFVGFRDLLVINEDYIRPGAGFDMHPHKNMEIITYVLEGELAHKDSMGNGSVIRPGDVQRMSAGRGILHSEYNNPTKHGVHLLQIWIKTKETGINPSYEEKRFSNEEKKNLLKLVVSPFGEQGSVQIFQDAKVFASLLEDNHKVNYLFGEDRHGWIQMTKGSVDLNGSILQVGDGASISDEKEIKMICKSSAEFILFDLP